MNDAREQILARIRTAIHTTTSSPPSPAQPPPAPQPPPATELLEQFIERLTDYGTTVNQCQPQTVHYAVLAACQRHNAQRVVIAPGLPDTWRPDGIDLIPDDALSPQQLDNLDGVITAAALGIAQTGTIALDAAPDQGRRALTLVPDLHICVIDADHIVASLPEAIETLAPSVRNGQPITFISGPSATSDIELRRVQGVHGPRQLDVIIINKLEPTSDAQPAKGSLARQPTGHPPHDNQQPRADRRRLGQSCRAARFESGRLPITTSAACPSLHSQKSGRRPRRTTTRPAVGSFGALAEALRATSG